MKQQITDHRMLQIYLLQNMLYISQTHELQKRSTWRCDVEARKLETQKGHFRICRCNFKVNKFGNLSQSTRKIGFISSGTFSKR